jgi:hypothetical protein
MRHRGLTALGLTDGRYLRRIRTAEKRFHNHAAQLRRHRKQTLFFQLRNILVYCAFRNLGDGKGRLYLVASAMGLMYGPAFRSTKICSRTGSKGSIMTSSLSNEIGRDAKVAV